MTSFRTDTSFRRSTAYNVTGLNSLSRAALLGTEVRVLLVLAGDGPDDVLHLVRVERRRSFGTRSVVVAFLTHPVLVLNSKLEPKDYLEELANDILYRKHKVGRLSAHLPPHILRMFARAVVLGKIRTYIHLSLKVRLSQHDPKTEGGKKLQVVLMMSQGSLSRKDALNMFASRCS